MTLKLSMIKAYDDVVCDWAYSYCKHIASFVSMCIFLLLGMQTRRNKIDYIVVVMCMLSSEIIGNQYGRRLGNQED